MGMGVQSTGVTQQSNSSGVWQQRKQEFDQMSQALKSGNLDAAKQAFDSLSSDSPNASDPNSPLAQIGKALSSGDLAGAQQAMTSMRGHHHHHRGSSAATTTDPNAVIPPPVSENNPVSTGTLGTNINTMA